MEFQFLARNLNCVNNHFIHQNHWVQKKVQLRVVYNSGLPHPVFYVYVKVLFLSEKNELICIEYLFLK